MPRVSASRADLGDHSSWGSVLDRRTLIAAKCVPLPFRPSAAARKLVEVHGGDGLIVFDQPTQIRRAPRQAARAG